VAHVAASGIYFIGPREPVSGTSPLEKYAFADGKTVEVGRAEKLGVWGFAGG
jgi:hypothetical protein